MSEYRLTDTEQEAFDKIEANTESGLTNISQASWGHRLTKLVNSMLENMDVPLI